MSDRAAVATSNAIEAIFRRDRWVTIAGLVGLTLAAWAYLVVLARGMDGPAGDGGGAAAAMMPELAPWGAADFAFMFLMWSIMMVAMMLPSASPMVLLHVQMNRQQGDGSQGVVGTAAFVVGYLVVWTGFSAVATLMQYAMERLALLSPMMVGTSAWLGAGLLATAGIYQLTPVKDACLRHCRSPVQFLMQRWRRGAGGAFRMGLEHGLYCLGCCWTLMALLFVGGVMNLLWIAFLAVLVLLEKVLPRGEVLARVAGAGFFLAAILLSFR